MADTYEGGDALRERAAEVDVVQAALGDGRAGSGCVVVVDGQAGMGKSRLLARAAAIAESRRTTVLAAAGRAAEQGFPFGVALQLVEAPLAAATGQARGTLLAGAAEGCLPLVEGRAPVRGDDFAVVRGLHALLSNLAARGSLAIVVDDAHWADTASVRVLSYLAHRIGELPITLVLGLGRGEPAVSPDLLTLVAEAGTRVVTPAPLGPEGVADVVRESGRSDADDRFCAAVATATGGNPLLVGELLTALPAGATADEVADVVPTGVVRWSRARLQRLGADAATLARALAVLGQPARLQQAARLAGLSLPAAGMVADRLAAAGLLASADPPVFAAPLLAAAALEEAGDGELALVHGRAARLLHDDGAAPELVAGQLLRALPLGDPWVPGLLQAEAERAVGQDDPARAERLLLRALDETTGPDARGRLLTALAEVRAGRSGAEAAELVRRALELLVDRRARVDALRVLGDALVADGRHADAVVAIRDGLALAGEEDPDLVRRLNASLVMLAAVRPEFTVEPEDVTDAPSAPAPLITPEERSELVAAAARSCFELEPHTTGVALARRALDGDRLEAGDGPDAHRWAVAKAVLVWGDDLDGALTVCDTALERLRRTGNAIGVATARACRATPAYWTGRLAEAAADAEGALAVPGVGWQPWFGLAGTVLVQCHLEAGEPEAAAAALVAIEQRAGDAPEFVAYQRYARARLREVQRRGAEALEDMLAAGLAMPHDNPTALPWRSGAAMLAFGAGDPKRAAALARAEVDLARRFGAPRGIGIALRALGVVTGDLGTLEAAAAVLRESSARLELLRALVDLGDAQRAAEDLDAARATLREALGLADECGAVVLMTRAREALVLAGGRPRRAAQSGVRALTSAERRVAELAAEGHTNREIADRLFVTPKTVAFHLSAVYRKLGVSSRAELTAEH